MRQPERFGNTRIFKIKQDFDELREACRTEGTPRIQAAIDSAERWFDHVYANGPCPVCVPQLEDETCS